MIVSQLFKHRTTKLSTNISTVYKITGSHANRIAALKQMTVTRSALYYLYTYEDTVDTVRNITCDQLFRYVERIFR